VLGTEPESESFVLLARLMMIGETCKCADGRPIQECPNYVEGDEEELPDGDE
jgi:hypothetical protein